MGEPRSADAMRLRPRRVVNGDNQFFWDGVDDGQLLIQRCADCQRLRHPARPMCPHCQSTRWDAVAASGDGTVFSYVVHHHPPLPGVTVPHVVATIDLSEGTRYVAQLVDVEPADVSIGMPVELTFVEFDPDLTLPVFRPAARA